MRKKDKWKWREMQGIYDIYCRFAGTCKLTEWITPHDLQCKAKKRKRKERHEMKTNILGKRCV